jgi:hypothetical protein
MLLLKAAVQSIVNSETQLQITEENGDLRILAGGHSYLMKSFTREDFLKQYGEAWDRVRLNFAPLVTHNKTIEFTPPEQLRLRQRIVLYWLYVYSVNNGRFKFLWWRMSDSQARRDVLSAAEAKYGSNSERAIAIAAHTLNMSIKKFGAWMKRDEEFLNR